MSVSRIIRAFSVSRTEIKQVLLISGSLISLLGAWVCVFLWAISSEREVVWSWSSGSTRYEVWSSHETLQLRRLHNFQDDVPFQVGVFEPETPEEFARFQKMPKWRGDNSWWERNRMDVAHHYRWRGFEAAAGTFWPPYNWFHPDVPFDLVQVPLWACVLICLLMPVTCLVNWLRILRAWQSTSRQAALAALTPGPADPRR